MRIAVCVKMMTGAAVDQDDAFIRAGRTAMSVLPQSDAVAVETALKLRESHAVEEIIAVSIGSAEATGGLKQALALGADRAVLLPDTAFPDADILARSQLLADLLKSLHVDLVVYCPWSGDVDGSLLAAMTATRLELPYLGQINTLSLEDSVITGQRQAEQGDQILTSQLPCWIEISDNLYKPRHPSLKGRAQANSKPLDILKREDIGSASYTSKTKVLSVSNAPAKRHPVIIDDGDFPHQIVDFLKERHILA